MKKLSQLHTLGLNNNDIRLYETLVELGPSQLTTLTKKAGLNRTSAYYMLDKLMEQGLIKLIGRPGKRKVYMAEEPGILLKKYDEYLTGQQTKRQDIKEAIKELTPLYENKFITPKVTYYQGVEGVKKVMQDAFSGEYQEVFNMMVLDEMLELVGLNWFGKLVKQQIDNEVYVKVLRVASKMKQNRELPKIDPDPEEKFRERRVLPKSISFKITSWIYGDKISYFSSKQEGYAMIVESKELVEMHKALFNYLWSLSTPLDDYLNKFNK